MTTHEVAALIGCSRQRVCAYVRLARLKAKIVVSGGKYAYDIDPKSVEQFLKLPQERRGRPRGAKNRKSYEKTKTCEEKES